MASRSRTGEIILHIAGCITFLALPILFRPGSLENFHPLDDPRSRSDGIAYLLLIGFFYLNFLVLVPRYYFSRRYGWYAMTVLACFFVIVYLPDMLVVFKPPAGGPPPQPRHGRFIFFKISNVFFLFLIVFFLSLMIRIAARWKQTEREKMQAELSYLKAQINPHFLFNTLNSIYSLAIQRSGKTAEAVVKLSGMMRYVTHEAHMDLVPLEKEIDYISNYIDLQRFRFDESVSLRFVVEGEVGGWRIAPLILISFVENAFKHAVNAEEDSVIGIHIQIEKAVLRLTVKNKRVAKTQLDSAPSGLGIENTRGRLNALYPGRYSLTIDDQGGGFEVRLKLELR